MLTFERANELFHYDPSSGIVTRKVFTSSRGAKGSVVDNYDKREKYYRVMVDGKSYQLHRVIMLLIKDELSDGEQVDHINHIRTDNRLENLRLVPLEENNRNKSMDRRNSTGITGVRYNKKYGTYGAHIGLNGKELHLGSFKTKEEAAVVRKSAEFLYGYHPNHGK